MRTSSTSYRFDSNCRPGSGHTIPIPHPGAVSKDEICNVASYFKNCSSYLFSTATRIELYPHVFRTFSEERSSDTCFNAVHKCHFEVISKGNLEFTAQASNQLSQ
jgi:hypothetical protein